MITHTESSDFCQESISQKEINKEKYLPIQSVIERNEIIIIHLQNDSNIINNDNPKVESDIESLSDSCNFSQERISQNQINNEILISLSDINIILSENNENFGNFGIIGEYMETKKYLKKEYFEKDI